MHPLTSTYTYHCGLEVRAHPASSEVIHCDFQQRHPSCLRVISYALCLIGNGFFQPDIFLWQFVLTLPESRGSEKHTLHASHSYLGSSKLRLILWFYLENEGTSNPYSGSLGDTRGALSYKFLFQEGGGRRDRETEDIPISFAKLPLAYARRRGVYFVFYLLSSAWSIPLVTSIKNRIAWMPRNQFFINYSPFSHLQKRYDGNAFKICTEPVVSSIIMPLFQR